MGRVWLRELQGRGNTWLVAGHQWCSSGFTLQPVLCSAAVSNPDSGLEYTPSKFAKDTKPGDADSLTYIEMPSQRQHNRLERWPINWCSENDPREVPGWIWSSFFSDSVPASLKQSCF